MGEKSFVGECRPCHEPTLPRALSQPRVTLILVKEQKHGTSALYLSESRPFQTQTLSLRGAANGMYRALGRQSFRNFQEEFVTSDRVGTASMPFQEVSARIKSPHEVRGAITGSPIKH